MANLGTRAVRLLRDYTDELKEGDVVQAECWLNLDAYIDCAEVRVGSEQVGLGRITSGGWEYIVKRTNHDTPHSN